MSNVYVGLILVPFTGARAEGIFLEYRSKANVSSNYPKQSFCVPGSDYPQSIKSPCYTIFVVSKLVFLMQNQATTVILQVNSFGTSRPINFILLLNFAIHGCRSQFHCPSSSPHCICFLLISFPTISTVT